MAEVDPLEEEVELGDLEEDTPTACFICQALVPYCDEDGYQVHSRFYRQILSCLSCGTPVEGRDVKDSLMDLLLDDSDLGQQ